jgi:ribonucleoside-diphosphate reductase beta chain
MFGGFTEGLQLFASFAMLMNFPRFNKMKGMGQIVSWSVRDESLHCEGITSLFHAFTKERDCLTPRSERTFATSATTRSISRTPSSTSPSSRARSPE